MSEVVFHPGLTQHVSECRVLTARDTPVTPLGDIGSVTVSRLDRSGPHGQPTDHHEQAGRTI